MSTILNNTVTGESMQGFGIEMVSMLTKAQAFCIAAHSAIGQVRKYSGEPYWLHPWEVAQIVYEHSSGSNAGMLCAAFLHDVVEDTQVNISTIEEQFGPYVASLVADLTDVSKPEDGNRATRKGIDREHTANASPDAKTIKLADLISNTKDILTNDLEFARVYIPEKRALLEVLKEGDPALYEMANALVTEAEKILKELEVVSA
jgi:(p)ppGpp synthase/HD superfamily hydrolase